MAKILDKSISTVEGATFRPGVTEDDIRNLISGDVIFRGCTFIPEDAKIEAIATTASDKKATRSHRRGFLSGVR